jgi:hypothetical protein
VKDFFIRRRRALSSDSSRCADVKSFVLTEAASPSVEDETSLRLISSSTSASGGGLGRKYVVDGGFWRFSSATVMELSRVLKA